MKPESIIKTGKSGQEIIKMLEAGIEERNDVISKQAARIEDLEDEVTIWKGQSGGL